MSGRKAWLFGGIAVLLAGLAAPPLGALEQGAFADGLYVAPGELFTVRSPLGPNPWVIDSFDHAAGAVTFVDEAGDLFGIVCTPSFDVLAGADNDPETDLAILRNWLHDATFPLFFERQLPGAAIVVEEPTSFEGAPAWIGVMHLPHGGSRFRADPETGLRVRQDSWRGLVVFGRGGHTFLLMTEVAPEADLNAFVPALSNFYHGIAFPAPSPVPADTHLAAAQP